MNSMYKRGFTLPEVMTVVVILAILSTIIFANVNDARKTARDALRRADLAQVKEAVNLFFLENGRMPSGRFVTSTASNNATLSTNGTDPLWDTFSASLFPNGLNDPKRGEVIIPPFGSGSSSYAPFDKYGFIYEPNTCLTVVGTGVFCADPPVSLVYTPLEKYNERAPICAGAFAFPGIIKGATNCQEYSGCNDAFAEFFTGQKQTWICAKVGPY